MRMKMREVIFISMAVLVCVIAQNVPRKNRQYDGDSIAFPQPSETNNKAERNPVYVAGRCPENEILYPGNQESDWICDCRPSFIYYPAKDTCYEAYTRGPCPPGNYLVLPKNQVVPVCMRNRCRKDNFIWFRNKCYELGEPVEPCPTVKGVKWRLVINATTLMPDCNKLNVDNVLALIEVPNKHCTPGSRRDHNGTCRPEFG